MSDEVLRLLRLRAGGAVDPYPTADTWVIDCETTGFGPDHRVVTFAGVELNRYSLTGRWVHLIFNPQRGSDAGALRVHGWSNWDLKHQENFIDYVDIIIEILSKSMIVGHNIDFDMDFLVRELSLARAVSFDCRIYCTMYEYRDQFPRRKSGLDDCLKEIGLSKRRGRHSSLTDAYLTSALYAYLRFGALIELPERIDMPPSNLKEVPPFPSIFGRRRKVFPPGG